MMESKQSLREYFKKKRHILPTELQEQFSERIAQQLFNMECFQTAETVAIYSAAFGEVSTARILERALLEKKRCYFPVVQNHCLIFVHATEKTLLLPNRFGILEPSIEKEGIIPPEALDIVLVPLLAFDATGSRLGMGGGFYDRTFAFKINSPLKPLLVGLAYQFQYIPKVPNDNLDIPLNIIVTEQDIHFKNENALHVSLLSNYWE